MSTASPPADVFARLQQNDPDAWRHLHAEAEGLVRGVYAKLLGAADSKLLAKLPVESVVGSVHRELVEVAHSGKYVGTGDGNWLQVWGLVKAVARTTVLDKTRKATADMRNPDREVSLAAGRDDDGLDPAGRADDPAELAAAAELVERAADDLSAADRRVVAWYLAGVGTDDTADHEATNPELVRSVQRQFHCRLKELAGR